MRIHRHNKPSAACAARVTILGLSVCPLRYSGTTGYEEASEWHQRLRSNEGMNIKLAIFHKSLRSRVMV